MEPKRQPAIAKVPLKSAYQHRAAVQIYVAVITYTSTNPINLLLNHTHLGAQLLPVLFGRPMQSVQLPCKGRHQDTLSHGWQQPPGLGFAVDPACVKIPKRL